jgi:deferrochelatase/peroxidase EfeB
VADRLQQGIYYRQGETPPAGFRLLLLNAASGADSAQVARALSALTAVIEELRRGQIRELKGQDPAQLEANVAQFRDLTVLIGFGRRLFDDERHDPPIVGLKRPEFLSYLPDDPEPLPKIAWHEARANRGQTDFLLQLTADQEAAVNRAAVEIWKRILDDELPLEIQALFAGFGRPDGRGWLEFHDGVSNMAAAQRLVALEARGEPEWMEGGTYLAFFRFAVDLAAWRSLDRPQQELLIGRDKLTGAPLTGVEREGGELTPVVGRGESEEEREVVFRDPPQTTDPLLEASHIHRANQNRASPTAPAGLRIFRQGYDFLEGLGPNGPSLGLNFISFQANLETIQHLLHLPGWLGDVNFGGPTKSGQPGEPPALDLISLVAGGYYAVPPREEPFPGAGLFTA